MACPVEECPYCKGTGIVTLREPRLIAKAYQARCLDCKGTGKRCSYSLLPVAECDGDHEGHVPDPKGNK